jgi:3-dehydroquinate synthase
MASRLAELIGLLEPAEGKRIASLIRQVGPLPPIRDLRAEKVLRLLMHDKKTVGGRIHWVLPQGIGKVCVTADAPDDAVAAAFRSLQRGESNA